MSLLVTSKHNTLQKELHKKRIRQNNLHILIKCPKQQKAKIKSAKILIIFQISKQTQTTNHQQAF